MCTSVCLSLSHTTKIEINLSLNSSCARWKKESVVLHLSTLGNRIELLMDIRLCLLS